MLVALAGCKSEINPAYCAAHQGDSRCPDGGVLPTDGMIDLDSFVHPEAGAQTCFGASGGAYEICLASLPTSSVTISNTVIDTDVLTGGLCFPMQPTDWTNHNQPPACFIIGTDITISNVSHAQGTRPLVILATGSITIDGSLDVSSKRGQLPAGAGHDSMMCGAFSTTPAGSNQGGGGGAGGSFMTKGGDGATGNSNANAAGTAAPADTMAPAILRGGCPGQIGGTGDGNVAGVPGPSGGAMYLVSGKAFTLAGTAIIAASGAGGASGPHHSGGSGGGSGGMIVLYAGGGFQVTTSAKLIANGGGSAGGIGGTGGGQNGTDGSSTNPTTVATGAGNGGDGYPAVTPAIDGTAGGGMTGGGGGGGAAGYIQANDTLALTASPTVTVR